MLDRNLIELLAADLRTFPGLIEKDWHVVRALGVIAALDHGDIIPVFAGGTSLSKGWRVIKRFSEDIDFKLTMPVSGSGSKDRKRRKAYRDHVLAALAAAEFELEGNVLKGNEDNFFSADFVFQSSFEAGRGLRPHLRVEMTFQKSALPPVARPIQSLIGEAQQQKPEVVSFLCVDPVETAADKLSALAWRVCVRKHGTADDDPTIIRHLHDLAALERYIRGSDTFRALVSKAVADDLRRGGGNAPPDMTGRFAMMLDRLRNEKFWAEDYDRYVRDVSFAKPRETIGFNAALSSIEKLSEQF